MRKYTLEFETKIRGQVTVEAESLDEALALGDEMAGDTLNYEELTDGGKHAPSVETECKDGWEVKEETPNA